MPNALMARTTLGENGLRTVLAMIFETARCNRYEGIPTTSAARNMPPTINAAPLNENTAPMPGPPMSSTTVVSKKTIVGKPPALSFCAEYWSVTFYSLGTQQ